MRRQRGARVKWQHPNAWTLPGTLALAFSCLGAGAGDKSGLRRTKRELDAIACVSLAFRDAMGQYMQTFALQASHSGQKPAWVILERNFDATPVVCSFGMLRPLLAPVARFWWRDATRPATSAAADANPWILLSYDEYKRRCGGREPNAGTLELLGQSCRVTWYSSDAGAPIKQDVPMAPVFIMNGTASNIMSALEDTLPHLSLRKLKELSDGVPFVALVLTSDQCAANTRIKLAMGAQFRQLNSERAQAQGHGTLLLIDVACASHILHNIVARLFRQHLLIPRLHAVAFCNTITSTQAMVWKRLRHVVAQDLSTHFFPGSKAPHRFALHTGRCLDLTVLRRHRTRGRNDDESGAKVAEETSALAQSLRELVNGDWRQPIVQHFCSGACCDRQNKDSRNGDGGGSRGLGSGWYEYRRHKHHCIGPCMARPGMRHASAWASGPRSRAQARLGEGPQLPDTSSHSIVAT